MPTEQTKTKTRSNIIIILFEVVILSLLFGILYNMTRLNQELYIKSEQRLQMLQAADRMRQSSDDLTHFGRTYVVTGKERFKKRYFKTLAIRNGKAKRPIGYDGIYWDLNRDVRLKRHPDGKYLSLNEIFKKLPFSKDELAKLNESHKNSDDLVNLEVSAFNAMKGLYQDKNGKYTIHKKPNQALAIKLMHSDRYYKAKDKIMDPIDIFLTILNTRTKNEVDSIQHKIEVIFYIFLALLFIFIVGNIFIYRYLRKIEAQKLEEKNRLYQELQESQYALSLLNKNLEFKIKERTQDLENAKDNVEHVNKKIKDSINYASLIQKAILPQQEILQNYTNDAFTIWQPKDTVGGDIYFITELQSKEEILIMVIDGAGHGVPGAFVTMLVKAIETQIVGRIKEGALSPNPAEILEYFNKSIKTMLKQEKGSKSNAGFDGGILYYNKSTKECSYAGAKTDLYIIDDNKLKIINGDKKNVGFVRTKIDQKYTQHKVTLKENTKLYISTDGVFDQEGENKSRYGVDRFENLLLKICNNSFTEQGTMITESFNEFKQDINQTDDVTVVGLNFK